MLLLTAAACGPADHIGAKHVLRFADGQDVRHLNTLLITTYPEAYPAQLTGAYLTRRDAHNRASAELASTVPTLANGGISHDGLTIEFHLRPGLRWSDGTPLTEKDAVFTADRIIAKDTPVASTAGWDHIASVDAPRAGVIRFHMKAPYGPAADTFFSTENGYSILPRHLLEHVADLRKTPFNDLPVGSGPFAYAAFHRGDNVLMKANPYYFRGRPKLDQIEYKFLPDENTLSTQILTGEVDIALRVQPTQLQRLRGDRDLSVVKTPSGNTGFIAFNTARPPFDDLDVRRALFLAIDRRTILERVYHGAGSISNDIVTPLDPLAGTPIPAPPPDVARAAALLDAAGWRAGPDGLRRRAGRRLTVDFVMLTGNAIAATIVEIVRGQWARLGVGIDLRTLDGDLVFAQDGIAARGDFAAMIFGEGLESQDLSGVFACAAEAPHGFNYSRFCSPEVDRLLARADGSQDPGVRASLYLAVRRRIATEAFYLPMIHREDDHFLRPGVTGFHPNGVTLFDDAMNLNRQ